MGVEVFKSTNALPSGSQTPARNGLKHLVEITPVASTLSTQTPASGGTYRRDYFLQGAAGDTAAESITIALPFGSANLSGGLANATDASQRLAWGLNNLDGPSGLAQLYEVNRAPVSGTGYLVLARPQVAASSLNTRVTVFLTHSIQL